MFRKRIVFLIGPTASGKSKTAIILAKKLNAEIIACDSMQIYRKMDIITAKDTLAEQKKIKHHLIDVIDPDKEYNVAKYRKDALSICDRLFSKGKIPLFVGGTGLYYSIIVDGIFPKVSGSKSIRTKLYKQLSEKGSLYLYNKLVKVDPAASRKIHPNDSKRVIRALEVYLKTGKPISVLQAKRTGLGKDYDVKAFGLNLKKELLYQRIGQRIEKMFKFGLIREVKSLLKNKLSKTACCAIGVPELRGYFKGDYSLEEARELMKRNSRRYAKRQLTWFRKDKRIKWINIKNKEKPSEIMRRIYNLVSASKQS